MNKIVYNSCFGGFSLSDKAIQRYADIKGIRLFQKKNDWGDYDFYDAQGEFYYPEYVRHDPVLVRVVEELGEEANGSCAELKIYQTDSNAYYIEEYDGVETVMVPEGNQWTYIK